jgi:hypothetical protein
MDKKIRLLRGCQNESAKTATVSRVRCSVPATTAEPAAAQQNNDEKYDEKCGHIHVYLLGALFAVAPVLVTERSAVRLSHSNLQ